MNQIDINLGAAWSEVVDRCRQDPVPSLRRALRQFQSIIHRPFRQWCLCLRASDRRITSANAILELPADDRISMDEGIDELVLRGRRHFATLSGTLIRRLTQAVHVPFPGEDWTKIAAKCGCKPSQLYTWAKHGTLVVQDYVNSREIRKRGKRVPIMYAPRAIDPNNFNGRAPDAMWGSLWEYLWEDFPEAYEQRVERVPRFKPHRGKPVFRGYEWICPGRWVPATPRRGFDADETGDADGATLTPAISLTPALSLHEQEGEGESTPRIVTKAGEELAHVPCGRSCHFLYGPMPVWTLGKALGLESLPLPRECGGGAWGLGGPGVHGIEPGSGWRTFACKKCWNVRTPNLTDHHGWNEFVTLISGGLLYGHEVKRPADEAPLKYRRTFWEKRRRYWEETAR